MLLHLSFPQLFIFFRFFLLLLLLLLNFFFPKLPRFLSIPWTLFHLLQRKLLPIPHSNLARPLFLFYLCAHLLVVEEVHSFVFAFFLFLHEGFFDFATLRALLLFDVVFGLFEELLVGFFTRCMRPFCLGLLVEGVFQLGALLFLSMGVFSFLESFTVALHTCLVIFSVNIPRLLR